MKGLNTWLLMLAPSCRSPVKIEQSTMGKTVPACYLPSQYCICAQARERRAPAERLLWPGKSYGQRSLPAA